MQLNNHAEELCGGGAAKALHDHPQSLSVHLFKHFGQVHKRYIQSFVLLPGFLLELSEDENPVCGAPVCSEPILGIW